VDTETIVIANESADVRTSVLTVLITGFAFIACLRVRSPARAFMAALKEKGYRFMIGSEIEL
jgi:hypothetical protein